jgi:hypothetical protein
MPIMTAPAELLSNLELGDNPMRHIDLAASGLPDARRPRTLSAPRAASHERPSSLLCARLGLETSS